MKGIYQRNYIVTNSYSDILDDELYILNKLGIHYYVVYNKSNDDFLEIEISIKYNINTLVNLNKFILTNLNLLAFESQSHNSKLPISYYRTPHLYLIFRDYPSLIYDLYEHILMGIMNRK